MKNIQNSISNEMFADKSLNKKQLEILEHAHLGYHDALMHTLFAGSLDNRIDASKLSAEEKDTLFAIRTQNEFIQTYLIKPGI